MGVEVYNKTKAKINLALVDAVTKAFLKFYKKSKLDVVIIFIGSFSSALNTYSIRGTLDDEPVTM
ncbi:MAG TPA: hypothetical protein PLJ58_00875, partial [bacterium]|nr:hypothetical protein [bacterium]